MTRTDTSTYEDYLSSNFRETIRDFAENFIKPRLREMEASGGLEEVLVRTMAANGWVGVTIPAEYGGMGLDHLSKTVMLEEVSRVSGAMGAALQASQLGVAKILHFGTAAQKAKWLPLIASGEILPTIAVTEHGAGGHVLAMQTTAKRTDSGYVLDGGKCYVGNSHIGDLHGVVARTGEGTKGLSAFLVETTSHGFHLPAYESSLGLKGFSFGEMEFHGCRVPTDALLDREGDGLAVAYSSSTLYGRPNLTAVALGIHRAILEDTVAFSLERHRYGKPLAEQPNVKQKLGQIQSKFMTARLCAYDAVRQLDAGRACDAELMNAKLVNVEYAIDSARIGMEIFAAAGLFSNHEIGRYLRDALHIYSPAGTSDVQTLRLAEFATGQVRQQWSERFGKLKTEPARMAV